MYNDIGSRYFFSNDSIKLDLENIKIIKTIKSVRVKSAYVDKVMLWENSSNDICLILNVYARLCEIPEDFIKKHRIKQYHISLIRRMYFGYDKYEKDTYLNFKRPYGNSYVIGDIAEEYLNYKNIDINLKYDEDDDLIDKWFEDNETNLVNIHNRVMCIFDLMLKELMIESTEYLSRQKHGGLNNWQPTELGRSEIMKINRIVKFKRIIK